MWRTPAAHCIGCACRGVGRLQQLIAPAVHAGKWGGRAPAAQRTGCTRLEVSVGKGERLCADSWRGPALSGTRRAHFTCRRWRSSCSPPVAAVVTLVSGRRSSSFCSPRPRSVPASRWSAAAAASRSARGRQRLFAAGYLPSYLLISPSLSLFLSSVPPFLLSPPTRATLAQAFGADRVSSRYFCKRGLPQQVSALVHIDVAFVLKRSGPQVAHVRSQNQL